MAAPSETSIANAALVLLGHRRINSLSEGTKTAKLILERYDDIRDETLRSHPWNFATKRAQLPADAVAPTWGFDNAFTLPVDCLRVLNVDNPAHLQWRIEGRKIVTDIDAPLNLEYTAQVTDVAQFDVTFRQALAAALAADIAEAVTGTSSQVEAMMAIRKQKISSARTWDGQEQNPSFVEASEWLDSREESGFQRKIPDGEGTPL